MWDAGELFYIVKHGVKFTGMPSWPAQSRDDEVWAVVAFLLTLPTLSADEYKRLAHGASSRANGAAPIHELLGPQKVPPAVTESCGRCHGIDGRGRNLGAFPKLAGQKPEYLAASLDAYARGWRSSGIMEPIAAGLSPEETAELARYYAALGSKARNRETSALEANPKPMSSTELGMNSLGSSPQTPASPIERGRNIAMNGIPNQRVPACSDCHGPSEFPRNPNYPALAGQYADYLVLQLTLFKKQARGGTAYAHLMRPVGAGLSQEQMRDVALYYESLPRNSKFNVQSSR
jgi:cytochrome c553